MYRLVSTVSHPIRAIHPIRHVIQRPIDSGRCCTVQPSLPSSRPIKKAVLARQSVALPRGEPQQLPARQPSIATRRGKIVPEQVRHKLASPQRSIGLRPRLPHFKREAVTASSQCSDPPPYHFLLLSQIYANHAMLWLNSYLLAYLCSYGTKEIHK